MKKNYLKITALLLLLCVLFCSCKKKDSQSHEETDAFSESYTYSENTDAFLTESPDNGGSVQESQATTQSAAVTQKNTAPSSQETTKTASKTFSKAEIVAYFNKGANAVKYSAKSVTRNFTDTRNDKDKTELPKGLNGIAGIAMDTFMKRDDTPLVMTNKEDIKSVFPVSGADWVSKLTENDVSEAVIEDNGSTYRITLTFGIQTNPQNESGYAAAFSVLSPDMVNFDYPGLSLSNQRFTYYDGKITADFDKVSGRMVYANYCYPVIIEMTAKVIGINADVKVGMTTENDFTVTY